MDEDNRVILVVEQLRDITQRKKLEDKLKESEERYRSLVELSPEAIVVFNEKGDIVFANKEANRILNYEVLHKNVYDIFVELCR